MTTERETVRDGVRKERGRRRGRALAADDPGGVLTLGDGGLSIPIYEEEVVVTKRVVLKERVVIRKRIETHTTPVNTELRRELVEIDIDESLKDRVRVVDEEPGGAARSR